MIENLLQELSNFLSKVLENENNYKISEIKKATLPFGVEVTSKISVKTGFLDDLIHQTNLASINSHKPEPLIDIIEYADSFKIVILLPGIKKENVSIKVTNGVMEIIIFKNLIYHKKFELNLTPHNVFVKSATEKNSIVEINLVKRIT